MQREGQSEGQMERQSEGQSERQIERRSRLSRSEFYRSYVAPGRPVIVTDAIEHWPARRWTVEHVVEKYGDMPLVAERLVGEQPEEFARSIDGDPRKLSRLPGNRHSFEQRKISVREYFERVDVTGSGNGQWFAALQPITRMAPQAREEILGLPYFDELQQRIALQRPLLWMGPAGCVSSLHIDKLPNLVVQLIGRKKWYLFPSAEMELVYLPAPAVTPRFSRLDPEHPDLASFPKYARARPYVFELAPGEALFVPPNWPHHVRSLEFSISLNFWWVGLRDIHRLPATWLRRAAALLTGRDTEYVGYGG